MEFGAVVVFLAGALVGTFIGTFALSLFVMASREAPSPVPESSRTTNLCSM
jgi:hypothetical protein